MDQEVSRWGWHTVTMATVAVFCGANPGTDAKVLGAASELGDALGSVGHTVVYGGGRVGLMGAVADAALGAGGEVVGFLPQTLTDKELEHHDLTELHITDSMHARKAAMCERADGFIVLPGGFGTLDEVFEILTWNQIGIIAKPVVFFDVGGYYTHLFGFLSQAVDAGFVMSAHAAMAHRATTAAEAISIATGPAPAPPMKWTDPQMR